MAAQSATRPGPKRKAPAFGKIDWIRTIAGIVTAKSSLFPITMLEAGTGTIRAYTKGRIFLTDHWSRVIAAGSLQLKGDDFVDKADGLKYTLKANSVLNHYGKSRKQVMSSSATPTINLAGSGTAGKISGWAGNLVAVGTGAPAGLFTSPAGVRQVKGRLINVIVPVTAASDGSWGGNVVLNASGNVCNFASNKVYVLEGYRVSAECVAVGIVGPDTGFNIIAMPGNKDRDDLSTTYWADRSHQLKLGCMPVILGSNVQTTKVVLFTDDAGGSFTVDLLFRECDRMPN